MFAFRTSCVFVLEPDCLICHPYIQITDIEEVCAFVGLQNLMCEVRNSMKGFIGPSGSQVLSVPVCKEVLWANPTEVTHKITPLPRAGTGV